MRIGEQGSARRETIEMRSFDERMTAEAADPIILIVNRDEEYVGMLDLFHGAGGLNR